MGTGEINSSSNLSRLVAKEAVQEVVTKKVSEKTSNSIVSQMAGALSGLAVNNICDRLERGELKIDTEESQVGNSDLETDLESILTSEEDKQSLLTGEEDSVENKIKSI